MFFLRSFYVSGVSGSGFSDARERGVSPRARTTGRQKREGRPGRLKNETALLALWVLSGCGSDESDETADSGMATSTVPDTSPSPSPSPTAPPSPSIVLPPAPTRNPTTSEQQVTNADTLVEETPSSASQAALDPNPDPDPDDTPPEARRSEDGRFLSESKRTLKTSPDLYETYHKEDWFWQYEALNIERVWEDYTGADIHVIITDNGFDLTHPSLKGSANEGLSTPNLDKQSLDESHGSHVAGVIAGRPVSDFVGVAPSSTLILYEGLNLKSLSILEQNPNHFGTLTLSAVNLSWGESAKSTLRTPQYLTGLEEALSVARDGLGLALINAGGNQRVSSLDANRTSPGLFYGILAIGATERAATEAELDTAASSVESNTRTPDGYVYASFSQAGANLLVTAPGKAIYTVDRAGISGNSYADFTSVNGTSFSAPLVSAIVALMVEANPELGWRDIRDILAVSAYKIDPDSGGWRYNGAAGAFNGQPLSFSRDYGFGQVDATTAVRLAETWHLGQPAAHHSGNDKDVVLQSNFKQKVIAPTGELGIDYYIHVESDFIVEQIAIALATPFSFPAKTALFYFGDFQLRLISPSGSSLLIFDRSERITGQAVEVSPDVSLNASGTSVHLLNFKPMTHFFRQESGQGVWTVQIRVLDAIQRGPFLDPLALDNLVDTLLHQFDAYLQFYTHATRPVSQVAVLTPEVAQTETSSDSQGPNTAEVRLFHAPAAASILNASSLDAHQSLTLDLATGMGQLADVPYDFGTTGWRGLIGGDGDDTLRGTAATHFVVGGRGDDLIYYINPDPTQPYDGGAGSDTISYEYLSTPVTVDLSADAETLQNTNHLRGFENIIGSQAGDTLTGRLDTVRIEGHGGADRLIAQTPQTWASYLHSPAGVTLNLKDASKNTGGHAAGDILTGFVRIEGSTFADHLTGNAESNHFDGREGGDWLDGDDGQDRVVYRFSPQAVTVTLGHSGVQQGGYAQGDRLVSIEEITGSYHNDTLTGDAKDNRFLLPGGHNQIHGGAGNDIVDYLYARFAVTVDLTQGTGQVGVGAGRVEDRLTAIESASGSVYDDQFTGNAESNQFWGQAGDDLFLYSPGMDVVEGGAGLDTLSFEPAPQGIVLRLEDKSVTIDAQNTVSFDQVEAFIGSDFGDRLIGDASNNTLTGGGGLDSLIGGAGDDKLADDDGALRFEGGAGDDAIHYTPQRNETTLATIDGGTGTDSLYLYGHAAYDIQLEHQSYQIPGRQAQGILSHVENILIQESTQNQTLEGNDLPNVFITGAGDDRLYGRGGDDLLLPGAGSNALYGGEGMDTVSYQNRTEGLIFSTEGTIPNTSGLLNRLLFFQGFHNFQTFQTFLSQEEGETGETYDSIEGYIGSRYDDILHIAAIDKSFYGLEGHDLFLASVGENYIDGGPGTNTVVYHFAMRGVTVDLSQGAAYNGSDLTDALVNIDNVGGTPFDDLIKGTGEANYLAGGTGNDQIYGEGGDDYLEGGAGQDVLDGGTGEDWLSYRFLDRGIVVSLSDSSNGLDDRGSMLRNIEHLIGTLYNDTLIGNSEDNTFVGIAGMDAFHGLDGKDNFLIHTASNSTPSARLIDGGRDDDTVYYLGSEAIHVSLLDPQRFNTGSAKNDRYLSIEHLTGTSGNNVLQGDFRGNKIRGGQGNDRLDGLSGNDRLHGEDGEDELNGGDGRDYLEGGAGHDRLYGGIEDDTLEGGLGDDRLHGQNGEDALNGGRGNDRLFGDGGDDKLYGEAGDDQLVGGEGVDWLVGGGGADQLEGEAGSDTVSYQASPEGVTVSLELYNAAGVGKGGHAEGDRLFSVEHIVGSAFQDHLEGNNSDNRLDGQQGDDRLIGLEGRDFFVASPGQDTLDGGDDEDTVAYNQSPEGVQVHLGQRTPATGGWAEGDRLTAIENVIGSVHEDELTGDNQDNVLVGFFGSDTLKGGGGNDTYAFSSIKSQNGTSTTTTIQDTQGQNRILLESGLVYDREDNITADGIARVYYWEGNVYDGPLTNRHTIEIHDLLSDSDFTFQVYADEGLRSTIRSKGSTATGPSEETNPETPISDSEDGDSDNDPDRSPLRNEEDDAPAFSDLFPFSWNLEDYV